MNHARTSPLGNGFAATYDYKEGEKAPRVTLNFDPNDPNLGWRRSQLVINPSTRTNEQKGARLNTHFAMGNYTLSVGAASDNFERNITSWTFSSCSTANTGNCSGVPVEFPGASVSIPNALLGNYMKRWSLGKLFSTAPFDVGLNDGWAVPDLDS